MKRSRKVVGWMVSAIALCWPLSEALAAQSAKKSGDEKNPAIVLSVKAGLLSATINDAPLRQVLDALARQVPLEVYYSDNVAEQKITDTFERLPLEEGIRRVLKDTSHVLSYLEAVPAEDGRAAVRKMEIRIATSDTGSVSSAQQAVAPQGDEARARLLEELIHKALHGAKPKDRVAALEALKEEFQEGEILPTFVEALKDKDVTVRGLALDLIATAKEPVPMNTVAEIALNTKEDRGLRASAVIFVGGRYFGENKDFLLKAAADPDKGVSHWAKIALKLLERGWTKEDLVRREEEEMQKAKELEEQEELAKQSREQAE